MRAAIAGACLLLAGLAAYVFIPANSPQEILTALLQESLGAEGTITLNDCDMFISLEQAGAADGPIALTRVALRVDMRNYRFESVRFVPKSGAVMLNINRKPVTDPMLDQADKIVKTIGNALHFGQFDPDTTRDLLKAEGSSLSFNVMAQAETTDGQTTLTAHEDAPDFYEFARAVEALPPPASFQSTTSYSAGGPSAQTLLTGSVVAVPTLQFSLPTQEQAKELAHGFFYYASAYGCV